MRWLRVLSCGLPRKHLRTLLFVLLYGLLAWVLFALAPFDRLHSRGNAGVDRTRSSVSKAPGEKLYSTFNCEAAERTCLVSNLYLLKSRELHVYLAPDLGGLNLTWLLNDVTVYTGIGSGGYYIKPWHIQTMGPWPHGVPIGIVPPSVKETKNGTDQEKESYFCPLYVHLASEEQPPPASTLSYHTQPLMVFSVLWENLFRTLYAGAFYEHACVVFSTNNFSYLFTGTGAFYTLSRYRLFFPAHVQIVLLDKPPLPAKFIGLLASAVHPGPAPIWYKDLEPGIYKAAVLGISRDSLVEELALEKTFDWRFGVRNWAFKTVTDRIKDKELAKSSLVTKRKNKDCEWHRRQKALGRPNLLFIARRGHTRLILNEEWLIKEVSKLPVTLIVKDFATLSLNEQICLVDLADILVSMHGAAIAHVVFMRPGTTLVELFPYAFKKYIYENLASAMGVTYFSWRNDRTSRSRTHLDLVLRNRFSKLSEERIQRLPIIWSNMDSKNYWRNQDTLVDFTTLTVIKQAVTRYQEITGLTQAPEKYLIYAPWEQLNNQLIAFKSACTLSVFLNRTLVLPLAGYHASHVFQKDRLFKPLLSRWQPLEYYFDQSALYSLPCRVISSDNFYSLYRARSVGSLHYHHISDTATSESQVREYYQQVLGVPFDKVEWDPKEVTYLLSKPSLLALHNSDPSPVLALGSLFWYYDFEVKVRYPLTKFYDYLSHPLYKKITKGLVFSERLVETRNKVMKKGGLDEIPFYAIHVRRGDYFHKCLDLVSNRGGDGDKLLTPSLKAWIRRNPRESWLSRIPSPLLNTCYTPLPYLVEVLSRETQQGTLPRVLYIATNADADDMDKMRASLESESGPFSRVLFQSDLFTRGDGSGIWEALDPVDLGLVDQLIAIQAQAFKGNLHSSFTRTIIEARQLEGLSSTVFSPV